MTPNPILRVLSTLKKFNVKSLLIGGQACIIYGAAEFSRDSDFVIFCSHENISRLRRALKFLNAKIIYVPPLEIYYLERGHACHFRCMAGDVKGLRIDVISKLKGCDEFNKLWERRNTVSVKTGIIIDVIGIEDLVKSKKTQRDKDWLMLEKLVLNDVLLKDYKARDHRVEWWLRECRDSKVLIELAGMYSNIAKKCTKKRPLISLAIKGNIRNLEAQLQKEKAIERQNDAEYWRPLRKELEILRHKKKLPL